MLAPRIVAKLNERAGRRHGAAHRRPRPAGPVAGRRAAARSKGPRAPRHLRLSRPRDSGQMRSIAATASAVASGDGAEHEGGLDEAVPAAAPGGRRSATSTSRAPAAPASDRGAGRPRDAGRRPPWITTATAAVHARHDRQGGHESAGRCQPATIVEAPVSVVAKRARHTTIGRRGPRADHDQQRRHRAGDHRGVTARQAVVRAEAEVGPFEEAVLEQLRGDVRADDHDDARRRRPRQSMPRTSASDDAHHGDEPATAPIETRPSMLSSVSSASRPADDGRIAWSSPGLSARRAQGHAHQHDEGRDDGGAGHQRRRPDSLGGRRVVGAHVLQPSRPMGDANRPRDPGRPERPPDVLATLVETLVVTSQTPLLRLLRGNCGRRTRTLTQVVSVLRRTEWPRILDW